MDDQVEESAHRASMSMSCVADGFNTRLTFLSRASTIPSQTVSPSLNSQASPTLSRKMATMKKPTTAPFPTVTFPLLPHLVQYPLTSTATTPKCPSSLLQWQHGVYSLPGNGSLVLQPFGFDGRQVMSSPCSYDQSVYTRYEQAELIKSYQVLTDPYHNVPRLNLFQFDGKPMQPMYLVLNPPQMLPTQTLNPTSTATPTKKAKVKRDQEGDGDAEESNSEELAQKLLQQNHHQDAPLNKNVLLTGRKSELYNPDKFWWVGVGLVAVGTVLYMWPTKQEHKYTRVNSS